jgi:hypothetical protein
MIAAKHNTTRAGDAPGGNYQGKALPGVSKIPTPISFLGVLAARPTRFRLALSGIDSAPRPSDEIN